MLWQLVRQTSENLSRLADRATKKAGLKVLSCTTMKGLDFISVRLWSKHFSHAALCKGKYFVPILIRYATHDIHGTMQ